MSHFLLGAGVLTVMFAACGACRGRPLHVRDSSPAAECTKGVHQEGKAMT